jgi:hypothetical protein
MKTDKTYYVTIPNKGEHELKSLLETIEYLRQGTWTLQVWTPLAALIDKKGGASRPYVGQKYDPDYIDLVPNGWTHDHCEICFQTISDIKDYDDTEGFTNDNNEWLRKSCFELFIKPDNVKSFISSLKTVEK